ncbi:PREDICTED: uncharacterized protein LOC107356523 [Acropora digitifera]|uniref:uncharacterized protein LOC107356523 n=1 Tax=Acropora digitifera TaxID=70779 RepID=UPI00077A7CD2|nr:PREDICTED: uncharacterized protein LOC107356523 [Acropora digitifera]
MHWLPKYLYAQTLLEPFLLGTFLKWRLVIRLKILEFISASFYYSKKSARKTLLLWVEGKEVSHGKNLNMTKRRKSMTSPTLIQLTSFMIMLINIMLKERRSF